MTTREQQRALLEGLLGIADESTRAMFRREAGLRMLQRECPHDGGWTHVGAEHITCCGCGLVTRADGYESLIRWSAPAAPEPAEAIGTALALWSPTQ